MDAWHEWGGDLAWGPTGDLLGVEGSTAGRQRVLRRLLTVEGEYIWNPAYGAGLPLLVGEPFGVELSQAYARRQMLFERAVAAEPLPSVVATSDMPGALTLKIGYTDRDAAEPVAIGFTIRD